MRSIAALALVALCAVSMVSSKSARYYRSTNLDQPEANLTAQELALSALDANATSTQMAINLGNVEEAAVKVDETVEAAKEAASLRLLDRSDVEDIKLKAGEVKEAIKTGDTSSAVLRAEELNQKVHEVAATNSDQAAVNLQTAEQEKSKPALASEADIKLLRAAVLDVVTSDPNVPPEQVEATVNKTVEMIAEDMKRSNLTNEDVMRTVEIKAANINMTNATAVEESAVPTDRHWEGRHWGRPWRHRWGRRHWHDRPWWSHRYHRGRWWNGRRWWDHERRFWRDDSTPEDETVQPITPAEQSEDLQQEKPSERQKRHWFGLYNPYYYYGYGYNSCLTFWSYPFCRRRLFSDYAYYNYPWGYGK